ncbi:hypothetical protein [Caulobacter sp. LjRoot300]|uniref:hypothetical protein n=1 Tax=Caulobacter sp. LjRoot300 TaxID=3342321 RepID=UPI003ECF253C
MSFWILAPLSSAGLAATVGSLPLSTWWQEAIVWTFVSVVTVAALALSIWGTAIIKTWLRELPVSGSIVFGLPLVAVSTIATAQYIARTLPTGPGNGMTPTNTQTVSTFLGVWTVLVAYQGKFFWDRAVEAWEKDGLRSIIPGLKRFNPLSKHLARGRLADRQAHAWLALRAAGPLDDDERKRYRRWRRVGRNRRALEMRGDMRGPLIKVAICLTILVAIWILTRFRHG